VAVDGLPNPNDNDLSWLKGGGRGSGARFAAMAVLWVVACVLAILGVVLVIHHLQGGVEDPTALHHELLEKQEPWADKLVSDIESYRHWFEEHGTDSELAVFDDCTALVVRGTLATTTSPSESLLTSLYISAHTGVIRALFLLIASVRMWIAAFLVAAYFGFTYYKPYQGDDLLGQTGNGRLFYSGARAGLESLSSTGAPDVLVRGLACLDYASKGEILSSPLWRALSEFDATNETNEALAAMILKHGDTASFVPRLEDEAAFEKTFKGASLSEYVPHALNVALLLHAEYAAGRVTSAPEGSLPPTSLSNATSEQYSRVLLSALHQVLHPRLREAIGALSTEEIATFILTMESGKILAHSLEAGKWFRRSNFPHLSARAILHSVLAYPREYSFEARQRIRQALVYASRSSSFAPVRMPIGMTDDTWALRQWAEVLLAAPHEIAHVVDELELVGLVRKAHQSWEREVLPKATSLVPDLTTTSYATLSNLLFLPLASIVALLRRTMTSQELSRLAQLTSIVGVRQQQRIDKAHQTEDGGGTTLIYDRVFSPIMESDVKTLCELHALAAEDLRDWSALRNILVSFGWLARRVGDYTVPESSVIFSVFKAPPGYPGTNSLNLIGKTGLVPLRGTKFEEIWGSDWDRRFQSFQRATMSENREQFEQALKGIKEEVVTEDLATAPPATV
jgi:hypothetical protein